MSSVSRFALCALVVFMGAFNAVAAYAFMSIGASFVWPAIAAAAALGLPSFVALVWLLWKPGKRAAGLAAGVGVINMLESAAMGSLAFLGAWNPGDGEEVLKFIALLVAPNLIVAIAAIAIALRAFGRAALGDIALGVGLAVAMDIVAGILAVVGSFAVDLAANLQYGERDRALDAAVIHVQSCAIRYAEQNPERGYPAKYEDMGPAGTNCIDERRARSMNVRYVADPAVDGRVTSFGVYGRTSVIDGEDLQASADTGGTVISNETNADSIGRPSGTESAVRRIASLRNCALLSRNAGSAAALPARMNELTAISQQLGVHVSFLGCDRYGEVNAVPGAEAFIFEGHQYTYKPELGVDGSVEHFAIEARPRTYGISAVNSYLIRDTGVIHRTLSDRAATTADPVIPACVFRDSVTTWPKKCAQLARPRGSLAVEFLHPDTVWGSDQFQVFVRDAKDTSRAPDPAPWTMVACQADSAQMAYMRVSRLTSRANHWCSPYGYDPARPYPVLLLTRDSLGALAWRVDTIALRPGSAPRERRRD
jgi:hypothetical protein